jgi:zinc D-Ala-D-Ala carboxypeptidase
MEGLTKGFHLFFEYGEFDSPDQPGSYKYMSVPFLNKLTKALEIAAIGFKISSGYRTPEHNEKVGGVKESSHTNGCAVDIYAPTSRQKYIIINALLQAGFNRIGVAKNFIHVDNDASKNEDVIWTY